MRTTSLVFLLLLLVSGHARGQADNLTLSVEVSGAKGSTGQVIMSLFTSEEHYLKKPATEMTAPVDDSGAARFEITKMEPGRYAISVVHDADLNNKLNTGLFGIPTELVGFSNNPVSRFGPPSFEEASFALDQSTHLTIRLGRAKKE